MAVKKTGKKPASRKKVPSPGKAGQKPGRPGLVHEFKKVCLSIAILLAVCLTAAMLADIFLNSGKTVDPVKSGTPKAAKQASRQKEPVKSAPAQKEAPKVAEAQDPQTKARTEGLREKKAEVFVYEVFEEMDPHEEPHPGPGPREGVLPRVAIIIDDIGYDKKVAVGLFELNPEITFSILPFSPFGQSLAKKLGSSGAELMLHLPMEPSEYPRVNPGPGALLSTMSPDVLLDQLRQNIEAVPGVIGVNNHMGSRLTGQPDQMNQIFTVLKQKKLFFIDSRTAPDSKGRAAARLFQLRFSQRDVFLDNVQEVPYITGQFNKLIQRARKKGTAIGIGHPYPATLEALRQELPKLKGQIQVVRASDLVAVPG